MSLLEYHFSSLNFRFRLYCKSMRILIYLVAGLFVSFSTFSQEGKLYGEPVQSFDQKLKDASPSDTLEVNQYISVALTQAITCFQVDLPLHLEAPVLNNNYSIL